jgi:hypothetical protein
VDSRYFIACVQQTQSLLSASAAIIDAMETTNLELNLCELQLEDEISVLVQFGFDSSSENHGAQYFKL